MSESAGRRTNMVNSQLRTNRVNDQLVAAAMSKIPREDFVPKIFKEVAYIDDNIPTGPGRYILEPMIMGRLLQESNIKESDVVLDIACGSGYSTAVLSLLAGTVVGLESNAEQVAVAEKNVASLGLDSAVIVVGTITEGFSEQSPYDVIFVNGAISKPSDDLKQQLAEGGKLIAVERINEVGKAVVYVRKGDIISRRELFDAFIPKLPEYDLKDDFQF